ncbi:MAG: DUF368 domain-containing protein [Balneolaceae bacterium]
MEDPKNPLDNKDKTTWKESPYLIIKGFLMGSADIVPGVSGGTMALITGIYERLINAIKSVNGSVIKNTLQFRFGAVFVEFHWKFFTLLFAGLFSAVFFFTNVVPLQVYMYTHSEIVYGLFFGLIVGSIFLLIAEVESESRGWKNIFPILAGALFGFWVVTLVPADTPETFLFVMLSGSFAICAMILPGISGSYILLILRKYDYILSELGDVFSANPIDPLLNLLPFIMGAVFGLALFTRLLSWLLNNYHAVTLMVLVGFLVGSLYVIWPYQNREYADSVRSVEVLPYSHSLVQELMEREEIPELPEYKRIGEISEESTGEQMVEVETVSRKLLKSQPFIPDSSDGNVNLKGGIFGMIGGLFMIWFISLLRKK